MILIGITGPSGSGKTTICEAFKKDNCTVHELDKIAKKYYRQTAFKLESAFGEEVVGSDGTVDTKALGKIVFSDKNKLKILNDIIFPVIWDEYVREYFTMSALPEYRNHGIAVIFDAPVLFETSWWPGLDYIFFIDAPRDVRIARLLKRGVSQEIVEKQADAFNYGNVHLRKQDISINNIDGSAAEKIGPWLNEVRKWDEDCDEGYTGWTNLEIPKA